MNLDALLPGHLAARLVGVSPQLLQWWRRRKINPIVPAGMDADGTPLYRVHDVLACERETRRSPKSSRHMVPVDDVIEHLDGREYANGKRRSST